MILNRGGNIKYRATAFTEHGAVMVATILNSPRAVQMSIFVVRAFLRLRELEPPAVPRKQIGFGQSP